MVAVNLKIKTKYSENMRPELINIKQIYALISITFTKINKNLWKKFIII